MIDLGAKGQSAFGSAQQGMYLLLSRIWQWPTNLASENTSIHDISLSSNSGFRRADLTSAQRPRNVRAITR